jgi:hypothetical protein
MLRTFWRVQTTGFMLASSHPYTVEPLNVESQHLSLPPPDFSSDEAALVSLNTGLLVLDVGGNASRSGRMR